MNNAVSFRKTAYALLAALILESCFFLVLYSLKVPKEQSPAVVVFGDSCYGNVRDETGIAQQLEKKLGKTVFNAALGGTCAGKHDTYENLDYSLDSLSLAALVNAIHADDFSVQNTMKTNSSPAYYFDETVRQLQQIDFSQTEIILIAHGTNDFYTGLPIENPEDANDNYTYTGALRNAIHIFREKNPEVRIILITPTYSWMLYRDETCEQYDMGQGSMEDYISALIKVAEETGCEWIDLYHDFYEHDNWEDWQIYTTDGMHPNEAGREKMIEKISQYLKGEVK